MTFNIHNTILAASMLASVGILASASSAQFTFDAAAHYGAGLSPNGIAHADFDGDGDIDLAVTASGVGPDSITVFVNAGDGTYGSTLISLVPTNSNPRDLVAGDLDGDGDIDLAVGLRDDPNGAIRIMFNTGNGTFTLGPSIPAGNRPSGMSIADMDGDGDLDIASGSKNSDFVTVVTNNGGGLFTGTQILVGPDPRYVAFGDYVPGGNLEVAVSNHGNRTVSIIATKGLALVEVMSLSIGSQNRSDGVLSADLNGDGLDDIALATSHQTTADFATIFINTGTGFSGPFNYVTGGMISTEVAAADLNCDGSVDLVISNTGSNGTNNVSVLQNNGDGTFGAAILVATGVSSSKATLGDFNNNGSIDFAVANTGAGDIAVAINHTCIVCPADVTGDGFVNVVDLLEVISAWGSCPAGCAADVNGDTFVNVVDLLEIVGSWGACL